MLGVVGVCGDGAGQDLGQKGAAGWGAGTPAWAFSHWNQVRPPRWHKHRNLSEFPSPRASLGHGLERAEGSGVAVKSDF